MNKRWMFLGLSLFILSPDASLLAAPKTIRLQGRLTDNAGIPICCNPRLRFELFASPSGLDRVWGPVETDVETNQNGLYSTEIGPFEDIDLALFLDNPRVYLQVSVRSTAVWQVLTPRQSLASVPYAMSSRTAQESEIAKAVSGKSIGTENIKAGAVTSAEIQNGTLQPVDFSSSAVNSGVILDDSISSEDIRDRSLQWVDLSTSAVRNENIQDRGIAGIKIATAAVESVNLADGAVIASKMGVDAVATASIQDEAVTAQKIRPGAVGMAQLNPAVFANTIPPGMIGMFARDCPQGWDYFDLLLDRFPRGVRAYSGVPQGSDTITGLTIPSGGSHAHAGGGAHTHEAGTLQTNGNIASFYREVRSGSGAGITYAVTGGYTWDVSGETGPSIPTDPSPGSEDGAHSHPIASDGTWVPSYLGVVYCVKN